VIPGETLDKVKSSAQCFVAKSLLHESRLPVSQAPTPRR